MADWRNHRVQISASDFRYITDLTGDSTLSKWGKEMLMASPAMVHQLSLVRDLTPWQKFWFPVAVDVDEKSRIIVAEMGWQRLQVYQKDRVAVGVGGRILTIKGQVS